MKYSPPVRYEVSAEHGNVCELMKCEKNLGSTRLELYKNVYGEIAIDFYPVLIQADFGPPFFFGHDVSQVFLCFYRIVLALFKIAPVCLCVYIPICLHF